MVGKLWQTGMLAWLLSSLRAAYSRSLTGTVMARLLDAAKHSRSAALLLSALEHPQVTVTRYASALESFNRLLSCVCAKIDAGLFMGACRAAGRGAGCVTRNSVIAGLLAKAGLRRILLAVFAMYMPLDVFLRSSGLPSFVSSLWDEAFLLLLLLYAMWYEGKNRLKPRITPIDAPYFLFLSIGVLLLLTVSPDFSIGLSGWRAVFQYMLFYAALVKLIKCQSDMDVVIVGILSLGVLVSLHGIWQYITAAPIPANWVSIYEQGVRTRAFSITGSPNILGDFCVMTAPLAAAMAYRARSTRSRLLYWACFAVICGCCLVTFSRGAWVGLATAAVVFALLVDRRLFAVMLLAGAGALLVPEIYHRLGFLFTSEFQQNNETGGRAMRWEYGLTLLKTHGVFLGLGQGMFGGAVAMQNQIMVNVRYFYLDNYYMKTLVEMGYLGLISYVGLLLSTLWMGVRSFFRCAAKAARPQAAGLLAAICGVLAHCFFENIFEVPYMNAYFWGFAAMLACCGFVWDNEQ